MRSSRLNYKTIVAGAGVKQKKKASRKTKVDVVVVAEDFWLERRSTIPLASPLYSARKRVTVHWP